MKRVIFSVIKGGAPAAAAVHGGAPELAGSAKQRDAARQRHALLGLAHQAALQLGLDEATRRSVQLRVTGQASCKDMRTGDLKRLLWYYKDQGAQIGVPGARPGSTGGTDDLVPSVYPARPTKAQWDKLERLALALGYDAGLDDPGLRSFVLHTTGVSAPRFMDRAAASAVISGLQRWQRQRQRQQP